MGKINGKMRKVLENRHLDDEQTNDVSHEEHKHEWTFVKEIERRNEWGTLKATYSKYVCYCGGVKKIEQFEVEE